MDQARLPDGERGIALSELVPLSGEQVLSALGTTHDGLWSHDAEARLARIGPNLLPLAKGPSLPRQLVGQLVHFFALMLWIAAGLAFVGRMPELGVSIVIVILVNGAFSFAQEYRAERAVRALASLLPSTVTVLREGHKMPIPAEQLVPGDLVLLREGDRISADARVLRSDGLRVDSSTLTGESEPLRRVAEASAPVDVAEAPNLVFAGTYVTSGAGLAAVAATGARTRLGSISSLTGSIARRHTPLRAELDRAVRIIAAIAVAAGLGFFGVALALGTPARSGFLFAIGVIVALVPEGLLPTLTLSLARGATRMARAGALVRHLEAVETLGATTVICSDKTGTITTNQMTARIVAVAGRRYQTTGMGYGPVGTILHEGRPLSPAELAEIEPLLRATALCGDARIERRNGRHSCVGDPTEGALVVLARKGGIDREAAERAAPRVREYAFESSRRRMSTAHARTSGAFEILTKGSPEAVLAACTFIRENGVARAIGADDRATLADDLAQLAEQGLRVLAIARRDHAGPVPTTPDDAERDLELLGLVGMDDPVRSSVPLALARCRHAGIRVLLVTGDHPGTAAAVARKAGLPEGRVLVGADLPGDRARLAELLRTPISVIARVAPEQKLAIAEALQSLGEVVAMTGDGVNDAPALRRADIGVAMGAGGTDVAREAADLVLLDDDFAHIVEAIEEGRAAFDNIRRFLTYHLTDNVAELAPFVLWALTAGRVPLALTVLQVLALDLGTDVLPALALGAERPEPGVMNRPPRPRTATLLDRAVLARAFGFLGPIEAVLSLAMLPLGAAMLFAWRPGQALPRAGPDLSTLSTMLFASIVLMQMANALSCRSTRASLFAIGLGSNPLLLGAIGIEVLALLAFVYTPLLARVLGQRPLALVEWAPILATPLLLLEAEEARKLFVRRWLK
jgi:magnesium-transporting ATPase (P-type)